MGENISIVFLFIGMLFLINLFYVRNKKVKISYLLPLALLLISFFAGEIKTGNLKLNILVFLGIFLLVINLSKNPRFYLSFVYSILLTIIYVFILNIDAVYLTIFNFNLILLLGSILNLCFANNINENILNVLFSGIFIETINLIYYQNNFNYAEIFNFSFLNFICKFVSFSLLVYMVKIFLLNVYKRRIKIAWKSHF